MAVMQMDKIHLVALRRDSKLILELLQRRGAIEVRDAGEEDEIFQKTDTSAVRTILDRNAQAAVQALAILDKAVPEKSKGLAFLRGRDPVSLAENDAMDERLDEVLRIAKRIVHLDKEIAESKAEISRAQAGLEALTPWLNLPVPQTFNGTRKVAAFIGVLDGEHTEEEILQLLAQAQPELSPVSVEVVWSGPSQTCAMVLCMRTLGNMAEETLRAIGFARPPGASHRMPKEKQQQLLTKIEEAERAIVKDQEEIASYAGYRKDLAYLQDNLNMRSERYETLEKVMVSNHAFVLTGYLPSDHAPAVQQELMKKFQCDVSLETAEEPGEDVPVQLKNSWFSEPVESVLEAYSLPGKGEVDPVGVMSIFYYIMFGLMFSDFGYGLIMFGVCLYCLIRFKNMEPNWSKNIRLFMWCGFSTMFWGMILNSYFGDVVDVVAVHFFGRDPALGNIMKPLWPAIAEDPMKLLMFCLAVGIVHLTVGYIMKGATCIKNKDYAGVVYDAVFPIVAWYPLVAVLMGTDMFEGLAGFKMVMPPIFTQVALAISGVCILGVVLTGGRESKNWGIRIMKGLYAVYNLLSGWLSDTLSYSRLLALGLATGVIAGVMNQMGTMIGTGFVGIVGFLAVFAVGQTLNFGINVLGAYVHSNRLEYVEFFGKFYDGGGQKFTPFGMHTKYYKIIEEETSK